MNKIVLDNGKYIILWNDDMSIFKCLRNGNEWRNLMGDNLIYSLIMKIEELQNEIKNKEDKKNEKNA